MISISVEAFSLDHKLMMDKDAQKEGFHVASTIVNKMTSSEECSGESSMGLSEVLSPRAKLSLTEQQDKVVEDESLIPSVGIFQNLEDDESVMMVMDNELKGGAHDLT
jgi:hypothetical protein